MVYLGIETCFSKASASIYKNGEILTKMESKPNNQSNSLTEMVKNLLKESKTEAKEITAVLTNKGAGSFTGIRVGMSFAEGFCFLGAMQKLYVSSFGASLGALPKMDLKQDILVIIHAIRGTFYVQRFSSQVREVLLPEYLSFIQLKEKIEKENLQIFGNFEGYDFGIKPILSDTEVNSQNIINAFLKFPHLFTENNTPLYIRSAV